MDTRMSPALGRAKQDGGGTIPPLTQHGAQFTADQVFLKICYVVLLDHNLLRITKLWQVKPWPQGPNPL